VWELFRLAHARTGGASTLLEWDGHIPSFDECHAELSNATTYMQCSGARAPAATRGTAGEDIVSNPVQFLVPDVMPYVRAEALRLQPSLSLHRYSFPVDAYYHGIAEGMSPDVPGPLEVRLCILRKDFRIGIFRLSTPQYDCLKKMETKGDIASALHETAAEHGVSPEEAARAFGQWRSRWIEQGFFVSV
jgi:hypothetical protein